MRERPINLRAHEVRGILDGRVTQVRRVVKPQPRWCPRPPGAPWDGDGYWLYGSEDPERGDQWSVVWDDRTRRAACTSEAYGWGARAGCPYGTTGDRLWVRETWALAHPDYHTEAEGLRLGDRPVRSDGRWCHYRATDEGVEDGDREGASPWRPSIHMPRWASRITLEITDVRVERVQDATDEDIRAEGTEEWVKAGGVVYAPRDGFDGRSADGSDRITVKPIRVAFASLWNEAYAKRGLGWDANPWVWVVEFRRVEVTR